LKLYVDPFFQFSIGTSQPIDRDVLMLPEIVVEDLSASPGPLLKSTLDMVWNACGLSASPFFDTLGNWVGKRK
jgi:hypothetical protein